MKSLLERILQIKIGTVVKDKIVFIDDINQQIIRRTDYKSLDEPVVSIFSDLEPYPYSHHWE